MCVGFFIIFSHSLDFYGVFSYIPSFIPDIGNMCILFFVAVFVVNLAKQLPILLITSNKHYWLFCFLYYNSAFNYVDLAHNYYVLSFAFFAFFCSFWGGFFESERKVSLLI